jgi:phosphoglycolate phosphatase
LLNRYDLVILDFDGTLADSEPWFRGIVDSLAERFSFRQVDDAEYERLRGEDSLTILRSLGVPLWKIPMIAAHLHKLVSRDWRRIAPFDGVASLLERLEANGVTLAMVSSNSEANVRRILGEQIEGRFDYYACGASVFGKASKFREVLKALKIDPARTLAIGDEERDIKAAREAGIAPGSVGWGYAAHAILKAGKPDHFFETMDDIVTAVCPQEQMTG